MTTLFLSVGDNTNTKARMDHGPPGAEKINMRLCRVSVACRYENCKLYLWFAADAWLS